MRGNITATDFFLTRSPTWSQNPLTELDDALQRDLNANATARALHEVESNFSLFQKLFSTIPLGRLENIAADNLASRTFTNDEKLLYEAARTRLLNMRAKSGQESPDTKSPPRSSADNSDVLSHSMEV